MNIDPIKMLFPPVLSLIVLALSYAWSRAVRRGKPLTPFMKKLLWYAPIFCLGMLYAMAWHEELEGIFGSENAWITTTVVWGLLLVFIAWFQHRKTSSTA